MAVDMRETDQSTWNWTRKKLYHQSRPLQTSERRPINVVVFNVVANVVDANVVDVKLLLTPHLLLLTHSIFTSEKTITTNQRILQLFI